MIFYLKIIFYIFIISQIITELQKFDKNCGILTFDFIGHGKSKIHNNFVDLQLTPNEEIINLKEIFTFITINHSQSKIIPICASHGALILSLF